MAQKASVRLSPRSRLKKAQGYKQRLYQDYMNRMVEIAMDVYEWNGLPDTVDDTYMEWNLMFKGFCLYFNDTAMGNLCLPCTVGGEYNINYIPTFREAYSVNGYYAERNITDSVIIWNNSLRTPSIETIELFAERLTNIDSSINVNVGNQKFPFFLRTTQAQKLSVINAFEQVESDVPAIIVDKDFNVNDMAAVPLSPTFAAKDMHDYKIMVWNEFLTWCGIENARQDKRERMTEDEIGSNYGDVEASRDVRLKTRVKACRQINEMFGTDISVRYNSRLFTKLNQANLLGKDTVLDLASQLASQQMGGNQDGTIYD